jgi:tetratricopeptide (TPR) repeat protein
MTFEADKNIMSLYEKREKYYKEKRFVEFEQFLKDLLLICESDADRFDVLELLSQHYHVLEDDKSALLAIQERVSLCPNRTEAWLALAEHYHYHDINLEKAATAIESALSIAIVEKCQVRQILGVRIRIALARVDYDMVSNSLSILLDYKVPKNGFDVALEYDFIPRIPVNVIDNDILDRYTAMRPKADKKI